MKRLACLLALPALLALGACKRPTPETVIVRVPVPVPCPEPKLPPRPSLMSGRLPKDATPDQVLKALVADLVALMGAVEERDELLKTYVKPERR